MRAVGRVRSGEPAADDVLLVSAAGGDAPAWEAWEPFYQAVLDEARLRDDLPRRLADLVDAGESGRVAELVRQWGRGERTPRAIWQEIGERR